MKKLFLIALSVAFFSTGLIQAQSKFGVVAGYSMNDEVLKIKNASPAIQFGTGHGFYVGGQYEYKFSPVFSVQTGLSFRKLGAKMNVDITKVVNNLNSTVLELNAFSVNNFIEKNGWDKDNLTDDQKVQLEKYKNNPLSLPDEIYGGAKGKLNYDLYVVSVPLSVKLYICDKFAVLGGVDLNYTAINSIKGEVKIGNAIYTTDDIEPDMLAVVAESISGSTYKPKNLNEFYTKEISNPFTVGLHVGAEYAITDHIGVQLTYARGLMSNIKKPFSKTVSLTNKYLALGMVYSF